MKLLVTGSREWVDERRIRAALATYPRGTVLVHGACPRGADALADKVGRELGFEVRRYPAKWRLHGRAAGHLRNQEMIDKEHQDDQPITLALAFPTKSSRGTWDCVHRLQAAGIEVHVFQEDKDHPTVIKAKRLA